jgi:hypothetical protein
MSEEDDVPLGPLPGHLTPYLANVEVRQRRVLELYREFGGGYDSLTAFCNALGPINGFTAKWVLLRRSKSKSFREALDKIAAVRQTSDIVGSRAPDLAQQRWPHLIRWKGVWLERFRETKDRTQACELVNMTWDQVEAELDADEAFKEGYERVNRGFVVAVEDAQLRLAMSGKAGTAAAASTILETQSERLSKLKARQRGREAGGSFLTNYDPKQVRDRARRLFQSYLTPPEVRDVTFEP